MADHAGFAAAVTIRERVLKTALLTAYANGSFPTALAADLPGGPPPVAADLFLGQPGINCEGSTNLLVLTLPAWGILKVTLNGIQYTVQLTGILEVTFNPVFTAEDDIAAVKLNPSSEEIIVRNWTATITSVGTQADVTAYIISDAFKARLQQAIRFAILLQQFKLPTIDLSFFGPLVNLATSIDARVRPGVLLLGLNVVNDTYQLAGDVNLLVDFARTNDIAGVVNKAASPLLLNELYTKMQQQVSAQGANLERFQITPTAGYFQVSGRASKTGGAINFSFRLVPGMFHTRPGKYFTYLPKPRRVKSQTWPALEFRIEGVDIDVDRSWWVIVLEVFLSGLTLGMSIIIAERLFAAAAENFSGKLKTAKAGTSSPRVQRTIPSPGGVAVRIAVNQFDVSTNGTYVGISVQEKVSPITLYGPKVVPLTYSGDSLLYILQLPSSAFETDPALRLRWTAIDQNHNTTLADNDGPAAGRLKWSFYPFGIANASNFTITARLYRQVGPIITELGLTSLNLQIRQPLPAGTYIRWRSEVSNPQIMLNEVTDEWVYNGEARIQRWSEWHRTDAPCRAVNASNRYRFEIEKADRLPFPLRLLENHRKGLCPYCFYGGPAGINPSL